MRRLELGADDEVDVELTAAPELDVLHVRRADHRRRARSLAPREHARDQIHLVPGGAGEDEICRSDSGASEVAPAGPVSLVRRDVVAIGDRLEPRHLRVENGDLVIRVESLENGRTDLACPDEEDPHELEA